LSAGRNILLSQKFHTQFDDFVVLIASSKEGVPYEFEGSSFSSSFVGAVLLFDYGICGVRIFAVIANDITGIITSLE